MSIDFRVLHMLPRKAQKHKFESDEKAIETE